MSNEQLFAQQVADLWDAVLNLSLPAVDQLLILEASGDRRAVDELALALDDSIWAADEALAQSQMSPEEYQALAELNDFLNELSGEAHAEKWTPAALTNDDSWRTVRRLASAALAKRQLSRVQRAMA